MNLIVILLVIIISLLCIALGFICWSTFFFLSKTFQLMAALDAKNSIHVGDASERQQYNKAVLDIMRTKRTGDAVAQRPTKVTRAQKDDITRIEDMPFDQAYEALEKVAEDGISG